MKTRIGVMLSGMSAYSSASSWSSSIYFPSPTSALALPVG
jgi:hypothetical protein